MSMKGFETALMGISAKLAGALYTVEQAFATVTRQGHNKVALDVALRWATQVGVFTVSSVPTDQQNNLRQRVLIMTAHGLRRGQALRGLTGLNTGVEIGVSKIIDADTVLLGGELPFLPAALDTFAVLNFITPTTDAQGQVSPPPVVTVNPAKIVAYGHTKIDTSALTVAISDTQVSPAGGNSKIKFQNNGGCFVIVTLAGVDVMGIAPGEGNFVDFGSTAGQIIGYRTLAADAGDLYVTYFA